MSDGVVENRRAGFLHSPWLHRHPHGNTRLHAPSVITWRGIRTRFARWRSSAARSKSSCGVVTAVTSGSRLSTTRT